MNYWILIDLLLVLGLTLRLSRLVVTDDLGAMWIAEPAQEWATRRKTVEARKRAIRYVGGLECPFCVGFWLAGLALLTLLLAGGPGEAADAWRWLAGWFTLNYVAAHIGARLGDVND